MKKNVNMEKKLTPYMEKIFKCAKTDNLATIVLPEGKDIRILEAANIVNDMKIANIIILGCEEKIKNIFTENNWNFEGVEVINPENFDMLYEFANVLLELRKGKISSIDEAFEMLKRPNLFAAMLVKEGYTDGVVSGAQYTTQEVLGDVFKVLKSSDGKASSLMLLPYQDRMTYWNDCAIIIEPTVEELVQNAISAAEYVFGLGEKPKIAMISYSTAGSGAGKTVRDMRKASQILKSTLELEEYQYLGAEVLGKEKEGKFFGEVQVDAALNPIVAKQKGVGNGDANVLVFRNLDAGNSNYKTAQSWSGEDGYGSFTIGIDHFISDMSRGSTVETIVGTIGITAAGIVSKKKRK